MYCVCVCVCVCEMDTAWRATAVYQRQLTDTLQYVKDYLDRFCKWKILRNVSYFIIEQDVWFLLVQQYDTGYLNLDFGTIGWLIGYRLFFTDSDSRVLVIGRIHYRTTSTKKWLSPTWTRVDFALPLSVLCVELGVAATGRQPLNVRGWANQTFSLQREDAS